MRNKHEQKSGNVMRCPYIYVCVASTSPVSGSVALVWIAWRTAQHIAYIYYVVCVRPLSYTHPANDTTEQVNKRGLGGVDAIASRERP